jgi:protein-S-isoprenylcysteine O-methyltransferase Ste14
MITDGTEGTVRKYFRANRSFLVNIYIAFNYFLFVVGALYLAFQEKTFDYNLMAYAVQSGILVFYILRRKSHRRIDTHWLHQCIALAGFYSGVIFIWQPQTGGQMEKLISDVIILVANILAIVTIFNLGRSFGIMIAVREVKTGGLYSIIRHPMYATDILLRIGFLVSHLSVLTGVLIVISVSINFYRAILEERYLALQDDYSLYMKKVKYRFIPHVI